MRIIRTAKYIEKISGTDYNTQPGFLPRRDRRGLGKSLFQPSSQNTSEESIKDLWGDPKDNKNTNKKKKTKRKERFTQWPL